MNSCFYSSTKEILGLIFKANIETWSRGWSRINQMGETWTWLFLRFYHIKTFKMKKKRLSGYLSNSFDFTSRHVQEAVLKISSMYNVGPSLPRRKKKWPKSPRHNFEIKKLFKNRKLQLRRVALH